MLGNFNVYFNVILSILCCFVNLTKMLCHFAVLLTLLKFYTVYLTGTSLQLGSLETIYYR